MARFVKVRCIDKKTKNLYWACINSEIIDIVEESSFDTCVILTKDYDSIAVKEPFDSLWSKIDETR